MAQAARCRAATSDMPRLRRPRLGLVLGTWACIWTSLAPVTWAADAVPPAIFLAESPQVPATEVPPELGGVHKASVPEASRASPRIRATRLDFRRLGVLHQAARQGQPGVARLNLFADAEFDWRVERTASTATGYAMSGPLTGVSRGSATLVVNGNVVVGSAWTPDAAYRIRTVGRRQVVERVEPFWGTACVGSLPMEPVAEDEVASVPFATNTAEDDGSEIDVLVAYTPEGRRRVGGHRAMLAEIDHDVAWTNEAYAVSDVMHRIRLVGAAEVDYQQEDGRTDASRLVRRGDGHLDEVHRLRDLLAADIVVFKTTRAPVYLQLSSLDATVASREAFAFAQVDDIQQFAHQVGHVLGLNHARGVESSPNFPFPYSHGYVLPDIRDSRGLAYRTIMAVGAGLPRYSNPRQRFLGVPLGAPGDEPTQSANGPADAARSMNETRQLVANYRRSATGCRYRLSGPTEVPAAGGTFTLRVEAGADCEWTARGTDSFLSVTGGMSGVGDGSVAFRVDANGGWWREVALAVAGQMHVAAQSGRRPVRPVCERSAWVRNAIEAKVGSACESIAVADLAAVNELDARGDGTPLPEPGDFDGLTNLGELRLYFTDQGTVPAGVFDGLTSLTHLYLYGVGTSLVPDSFRGLENLADLQLLIFSGDHADALPPLPSGALEGMPRLRELLFRDDSRTTVVPGLFDGLVGVRDLLLIGAPTHLPAGAFRGLQNLRRLRVDRYVTTPWSLEIGTLDGMPARQQLDLRDSQLSSLPSGVFDNLPQLLWLYLNDNRLTTLPPGLFDRLAQLRGIDLSRNRLGKLPPNAFEELPLLGRLRLHGNQLTALPPGIFVGAGALHDLTLHGNLGSPFTLEVAPVVATAAWQRPVRVAARIAEGAPFAFDVPLNAAGGRLEASTASIGAGATLGDDLAVWQANGAPIVVRVAGLPAPKGAGCAAEIDAGGTCSEAPLYTGIELAAGPPLVLNGFATRSDLDAPAVIDLANVFLEFDSSARPTFTVRTSDPDVAVAEVTGRVLRVVPLGLGTATITVTATAADGRTATRALVVTAQAEPRLRGWRWKLFEPQ